MYMCSGAKEVTDGHHAIERIVNILKPFGSNHQIQTTLYKEYFCTKTEYINGLE